MNNVKNVFNYVLYLIRKFFFLILVILFSILFVCFGYIAYVETHASRATDYLIDKYEFSRLDFIAYKTTEYVYEDIADCSSLWFKKCTSDKDLYKISYFIMRDKTKIKVAEDLDGNFTDNYDEKKDN